jgi:hypothetical protein
VAAAAAAAAAEADMWGCQVISMISSWGLVEYEYVSVSHFYQFTPRFTRREDLPSLFEDGSFASHGRACTTDAPLRRMSSSWADEVEDDEAAALPPPPLPAVRPPRSELCV